MENLINIMRMFHLDYHFLLSLHPPLSGWGMNVSVAVKMLSIQMLIPDSARGQVTGLFGNYNGIESDDFTGPDGTSLPLTASMEEIHAYGLSCEFAMKRDSVLGRTK